jgi:glycine dehydrogenase subunit 1
VHPEYRQVLNTYAKNLGLQIEEIGYTASGQLDRAALKPETLARTAAVVVQSPNFFGVLEEIPALAEAAHASGALLVIAITEAVSLGIVRPPAEADIVAMEGQAFGIPSSYGGPYVGVIATREKFVRQMPGRLAGQTTDAAGNRGFVLTLATREQHIRREKATSNICTNEALYALAATIHLCLIGKEGLREQALQNLAKARFAQAELEKIPGVRRVFTGPTFNEFSLEFPRSVKMINADLLKENIIGPFALGTQYPDLTKRAVICVTETTPRAEIERFAAAVRRILERPV